jgi:hypothetical protein
MATYKWTGEGAPGDYNDPRNWNAGDDAIKLTHWVAPENASAPVSAPVQAPAAPTPPMNEAYAPHLGGGHGATRDLGETDDPLTNNVSYKGNVYYIDSVNGSDNNTGLSPDQAWKTLEQAATKFHVGYWDTIAPNANTDPPYHEPWTAAPSGSAFLFMRGGTYEGSIDVYPLDTAGGGWTFQNNYTFGAYGDPNDPRPVIETDTGTAVRGYGSKIPDQQFDIRNLHFVDNEGHDATGMFLNDTNGVNIVNTEIEGFWTGVGADNSKNLTIQNSIFYDNGSTKGHSAGLAAGGENLKLLDSTFIDNGRSQIFDHNAYLRYLDDAVVEGNLFVGGSNMGLVVHGINDGLVIRDNEFYGNNNGLSVSGANSGKNNVSNNVLIEDNIIRDNGYGAGEQGYGMFLNAVTNAVIRDNEIYGNRGGSLSFSDAGVGDQQSRNVDFYNNLFSGTVSLTGSKTIDLSFENNIFTSDSKTSFALVKQTAFPDSQLTLDHNLYFMPDKVGTKVISYNGIGRSVTELTSMYGKETHGLNADPLFADAANHNYELLPGSPAIDRGVVIPGATDDFDGTPRPQGNSTDIGPQQYHANTDQQAPAAPAITAFAIDDGIVGAGVATSDNTIELEGTAEAGSEVRIFDGQSLLGVVSADANGTWSFSTPALADGVHSLRARAADAAGNISPASGALDVLVDTKPPVVMFDAVDFAEGAPTLTLSGRVGDNVVVTAVEVFNGDTSLGFAVVDNTTHTWSLSVLLPAGTYNQLKAKAIDGIGNSAVATVPDTVAIDVPSASGVREMITHADGSKEVFISGITGQRWTATETLYTANGKPVSQICFDGETVVRTQAWNADGSVREILHANVTGQAYTDYGVTYGANNKPVSATYSNGMTQTWVYNTDGTLHELIISGITGQKWTSTDTIYGDNGKPASQVWSDGDTVLRTQTWNADGSVHDVHYYGVTGQAYTDYQVFYGANNKPANAVYSNGMEYTWTYNTNGSLHELLVTGITGQKWTSTDTIYNDNGKPVSQVWSDGDTVLRTQTWNADGSGHTIHYYGITGQAYTDYEMTYGANNKALSASYSNGMTVEWDYKDDGFSVNFDHVQGAGFQSYVNVYDSSVNASGQLAVRSTLNTNGSETIRGYEDGLTFVMNASGAHVDLPGHGEDMFHFAFNANTTMTGGGANTSFVFQSGFGNVTITDFVAHSLPNSDNDTITFAHGLFQDFADLQAHMTQNTKTGATVITDHQGNTLTLTNTQVTQLSASDFMLL